MGLLSNRDPKLAKSLFNLSGSAIKAGARTAWKYPKSTALVAGGGSLLWASQNAPVIAGQAIGAGGGEAAGQIIGSALYKANHDTADFVSYPYRIPSRSQIDYDQPMEVPRFEDGQKVGTQILRPEDRPQWRKTRNASEREIRDIDIRLRKTKDRDVRDIVESPSGQKRLKALTAANISAGVSLDEASNQAREQYTKNIAAERKDKQRQYGNSVVSNPETGRKAYQDRLLARRKYEGREGGLQLNAPLSTSPENVTTRRKLLTNSIDVFRSNNQTRNAVNIIAKYTENPSSITPEQYTQAVKHIKENPQSVNALKEAYRDIHSLRTKKVGNGAALRPHPVTINVSQPQRNEEWAREATRRHNREMSSNLEGVSDTLGAKPKIPLVRTYDQLKRESGSSGAKLNMTPNDLRYSFDPRQRDRNPRHISTLPPGAGTATAAERALSRLNAINAIVNDDGDATPGGGLSRWEITNRGKEQPLTPLDLDAAERIRQANPMPRANPASPETRTSTPVDMPEPPTEPSVSTSTGKKATSSRVPPAATQNVSGQPPVTPGTKINRPGSSTQRRRVPTGQTGGQAPIYIINQPTYGSPDDMPGVSGRQPRPTGGGRQSRGSQEPLIPPVDPNAAIKQMMNEPPETQAPVSAPTPTPVDAPPKEKPTSQKQGGLINAFNRLPNRQKGLLLGGAGLAASGAVIAGGKYLLDRAQEDKRRRDIEAYRQYV